MAANRPLYLVLNWSRAFRPIRNYSGAEPFGILLGHQVSNGPRKRGWVGLPIATKVNM